jgi:tetratricopeptide (TPR) repeat protein
LQVTTDDQQLALAEHYLGVGRPADALRTLDDALGDGIGQPEYWLIRSRANFELDRWHDGAQAAVNGLELDPHDVDLLNILALCQLEAGHPKIAEGTLVKALEVDPENHVLLANRALVLARAEHFDEARETVDEAVSLAPWSTHALRVRAQVAVLAGDRGAEKLIDELLERDPEDEVGHILQGNMASRKKRFVAASRAFDEAARLDPTNESLVGTARRARAAAHPLLAPLRPIWRVGWFRARLVFIPLVFVINALGYGTIAEVLLGLWLALIVLSWTAPRYVRWRMRRRYGGF